MTHACIPHLIKTRKVLYEWLRDINLFTFNERLQRFESLINKNEQVYLKNLPDGDCQELLMYIHKPLEPGAEKSLIAFAVQDELVKARRVTVDISDT